MGRGPKAENPWVTLVVSESTPTLRVSHDLILETSHKRK